MAHNLIEHRLWSTASQRDLVGGQAGQSVRQHNSHFKTEICAPLSPLTRSKTTTVRLGVHTIEEVSQIRNGYGNSRLLNNQKTTLQTLVYIYCIQHELSSPPQCIWVSTVHQQRTPTNKYEASIIHHIWNCTFGHRKWRKTPHRKSIYKSKNHIQVNEYN